jgi:hypothetical protein
MTFPKYRFKRSHLEAWIWITALLLLAATNPDHQGHFSLCAFKNMGFDYCPGCGLGHSISMLFRGRVTDSFTTHPLGIFAIIMLIYRCYALLKPQSIPKNYEQNSTTTP